MKRLFRAAILACFIAASALHSQKPAAASVSGTVLDPSGAVIAGAQVHLHGNAADRNASTNGSGQFTFSASPGTYTLVVEADGFGDYTRTAFTVTPQRNTPLVIQLAIATKTEQIDVPSDSGLSNDADDNKSALIFKNEQLDTFSDDPAAMRQELLALASSDPSNPPQIYVDGFSNGTLPPKESIREIRINQNPFSAQYDQFGGGRIEVFTKPGANKLHGSLQGNYGNSTLNARNPYAGAQPSYNNDYFVADLNGPLGRKSSFYLSGERSDTSESANVNATILDPATLLPIAFSQVVANQTVSQTYSIRIDRQFSAANTFIGRYTFSQDRQPNAGIGLLTLGSQAAASDNRAQTLQLTDTHIFNPKVILDSGLQYIRTRTRSDAFSTAPSITVQGAFNGGGGPAQSLHDNLDRFELQEYLSIELGPHFIRTGLRYRMTRDANFSNAGYNGQYIFPDIATYQRAQQDLNAGLNGAAIASRGDGPTQFSLSVGNASASLATGDIGIYAEDEWKATPTLTLNYGLRIESQSAIPDHFDVAPRLGIAYSVIRGGKTKSPVAVIRGGFGLFYQRFASGNILQSLRQNGVTQQSYYVTNPVFYTGDAHLPDLFALSLTPSTVYRISPRLRSPMQMQGFVTVEHAFGKHGSIVSSLYLRRSVHQFESLNINAPLPGTYDPSNPASGTRPLGGTQNIYQYSSDGISNGRTFVLNANVNASKKLTFYLFGVIGHQESDVLFGSGSFASNSYNVSQDAGPSAGYSARQLYVGLNARPGWETAFNAYLATRSSSNFNITTGQDNNGDTIYNDRPSFATDLSRPSVVHTSYGVFDTDPIPGQTIIPTNYGTAPGVLYLVMSLNKTFHFGPRPPTPPRPAPAAKAPVGAVANVPLPPRRYRLQVGISSENVPNFVNRGAPVGVLSSPNFGKSISINNMFSSNYAANRSITLRTAIYF